MWEVPGRPVSRVLYPAGCRWPRGRGNRWDGDHLSSPPGDPNQWGLRDRPDWVGTATLPLGSSGQPGSGPDAHCSPIWPCSRWGLAVAALPPRTGRSYRPISPLPRQSRGGVFLCHFPSPAASPDAPMVSGRSRRRSLGVTQHPVQWSPDFPPSRLVGTAVTRSVWLPPNRTLAYGYGGVKLKDGSWWAQCSRYRPLHNALNRGYRNPPRPLCQRG